MKLFLIIFTALFALSFISVSYAEPVYTITADYFQHDMRKGDIMIFLDKGQEHLEKGVFGYKRKSFSMYDLRNDECLQLTADQFNDLVIRAAEPGIVSKDYETPGNYKIILNTFSETSYRSFQMIVTRRPSEGCIDIEEWMAIKEHEHFTGETSVYYADESIYTITPGRTFPVYDNNKGIPFIIYLHEEKFEEMAQGSFLFPKLLFPSYAHTVSIYRLESDECLSFTADQFDDLVIHSPGLKCSSLSRQTVDDCKEIPIPLRNYEIHSTRTMKRGYVPLTYQLHTVSQPSEGCTDIEEWMAIKEQEYQEYLSSN